MNGALWINVEIPGGSHIDAACQDAVELANKLGVMVWFDFNAVHCGARPGDDWALLVRNFNAVMGSKSTCKVACANPMSAEGPAS